MMMTYTSKREALWVVALVHPESLSVTGSKGHDIISLN